MGYGFLTKEKRFSLWGKFQSADQRSDTKRTPEEEWRGTEKKREVIRIWDKDTRRKKGHRTKKGLKKETKKSGPGTRIKRKKKKYKMGKKKRRKGDWEHSKRVDEEGGCSRGKGLPP